MPLFEEVKEIAQRIKQLEKDVETLSRTIEAHNGARIILNGDLRVSATTFLNGGNLGGE
jgi:hypothetical protein